MKKKNKILSLLVVIITIFSFNLIKAEAATTWTATMSSSASQVVVGNTVTITVKVSSSKALGAFEYNLSYNSSYLSLTSGSSSGVYYTSNGTSKTTTYTFKFKALKSGTASVTFNATGIYDIDDNAISNKSASKSIKIITQAELEASYSSNNNLSSLSVDGYDLSPTFSSSVTSYTVDLPANTESITVSAKVADSTATISGTGEVEVVDGANTINILVTAQNGSTKKYTITANVEELDPITVTIGNNTYTVIRKAKLLESPSSNFIESTTTIDDSEVPTLYNEAADLTLVGLKDEDGNIELYIYDSENDSYTKYNQYTFASISLYILDKEVNGADGTKTITIEEDEVIAYTIEDDEFYYFYAINLETGEENLYRYDEEENTVQRCALTEDGEILTLTDDEELNLYRYVIIGLLGFLILTYIIILFNLLFNKKKKKKTEVIKPVEEIEEVTPVLTDEEKEIHKEIERIGTQEINLKDIEEELNKNDDTDKVTEKEKDELIKETEEELNRINNANPSETNELVDTINEVLEEENKNKKKKSKSKNKNKKSKKKEEDIS